MGTTMLRLGRRSFLMLLGALGLTVAAPAPKIVTVSRWIVRAADL
jgi:hypothetical protein